VGLSVVRNRPGDNITGVTPHQPRPASDAAHTVERGGVGSGPCRVQEGARIAERDPAGGVVQLTLG